jgi:16S rRNA (adenine1518-N6/adenine1519-N6)-dimethyltransferase
MIASKEATARLLAQYGVYPKKKYGQNFLIHAPTAQAIVSAAELSCEDIVIEIGPGLGALTELIAPKVAKVYCYEIDESFVALLQQELRKYTHVEIHHADFLKVDLTPIFLQHPQAKVHVISNLPYYLTSALLTHLLIQKHPFASLVTMLQKEVADRIFHNQGGKDFNELSLYSHLFAKVDYLMEVSKNYFYPRPEVDSAVLRFLPLPYQEDRDSLLRLIQILFAQRRKTILNNLQVLSMDKETLLSLLQELNIAPNTRAEALDITTIHHLHQRLKPYL